MLSRWVWTIALAACQDRSAAAPTELPAIEVRDARGAIAARVVPGHPCRGTVDGFDLQIGGPPLISQYGETKWTSSDAENGTTFSENGAAAARIHANQLFDAQGVPVIRVMPDGGIADAGGRIARRAVAGANSVSIGDTTVTNTTDVVLAAMLAAREARPEVRALVACHLLFASEKQKQK